MKPTAEIKHINCGGQVAWYLGAVDEVIIFAKDIMFLDFSQPVAGEKISFDCPLCNENVSPVNRLYRDYI